MNANFPASLEFVWRPGFDSPQDGYHKTQNDPGGGTFGGVTEVTWANAVRVGLVTGVLANATIKQLTSVYRELFWGSVCDDLPAGLDLLLFNGRMLTGRFPWLFQQCLGFIGADDVDGWIGPESLKVARSRDPETFIDSVCGSHAAYLSTLDTWPVFGNGWTARIRAVQIAARAMADGAPIA
jgi:lysozyme family protein